MAKGNKSGTDANTKAAKEGRTKKRKDANVAKSSRGKFSSVEELQAHTRDQTEKNRKAGVNAKGENLAEKAKRRHGKDAIFAR